ALSRAGGAARRGAGDPHRAAGAARAAAGGCGADDRLYGRAAQPWGWRAAGPERGLGAAVSRHRPVAAARLWAMACGRCRDRPLHRPHRPVPPAELARGRTGLGDAGAGGRGRGAGAGRRRGRARSGRPALGHHPADQLDQGQQQPLDPAGRAHGRGAGGRARHHLWPDADLAPPADPTGGRRMSITLTATPVLETERLTLRAPQAGDWPAYRDFALPGRARFVRAPDFDEERAWRAFAAMIGHWVLRGWGSFVFIRKGEARALGMVGPWFPQGWPEREILWMAWDTQCEG